jgi:hypothetical protein
VLVAYALATLLLTWPLATRMTTAIGGDFGDSTFVAWVIAWVTDHLTALLGGDVSAWTAMWNAPMFAPEPATLTYSEHLIGPSLQVLPLTWAGAGPVTAYNAVLLATIALTGVAAHRLTFHLTGSHVAAGVAGLLATFNDYRFFWSLGHLQTLSIHWWIFALWGADVFIARGSRIALAATVAALALLNLSSQYLMAYAAPFTVAFCVWSMARHGHPRDRGRWLALAAAGAVSVLAIAPLVLRYLDTSRALGFTRSVEEIAANSATLAAYAGTLPWFGPLLALAVCGVVAPTTPRGMSRGARTGLLVLALAAVVLSMGPTIAVGPWRIPGPYRLLLEGIPGFSGLRVTHRFVVIAVTLLAVLAGAGAAWLVRWRSGWVAVVAAAALATRTAWSAPFPIDREIPAGSLASPPAYLRPADDPPAIYQSVRALPMDAVLVEFPFGETAYEVRYTFFTHAHAHRTLNGYSGVLPRSYLDRREQLNALFYNPARAWAALDDATHAIVHPAAWPDDTGARIRKWLESRGARVMDEKDGAWLFWLRVPGARTGDYPRP